MASSVSFNSIFVVDLDENILITSNYIGWCITLSYILFVKFIGPRLMKDRPAFDLRPLMIVYNFTLCILNAYAAFSLTKMCLVLWPHRCEKAWMYEKTFHWLGLFVYLIKFLELFDTVIFILRKKSQQVSFLHVYHHSAVFTFIWIAYKYKLAGYFGVLIGTINTAVHLLLYTYYGLSALSPRSRKYLWWKKYLTTIQLAQFFVAISYMAFDFVSGCSEFDFYNQIAFVAMVLVTALFINFYYKTYKVKKQ